MKRVTLLVIAVTMISSIPMVGAANADPYHYTVRDNRGRVVQTTSMGPSGNWVTQDNRGNVVQTTSMGPSGNWVTQDNRGRVTGITTKRR